MREPRSKRGAASRCTSACSRRSASCAPRSMQHSSGARAHTRARASSWRSCRRSTPRSTAAIRPASCWRCRSSSRRPGSNRPPASSPASLALLRPGDPAFDPWCLTDPIERRRLAAIATSVAKLDDFWTKHPEVEQLLALQSEILAALQAGTVDYMPSEAAGSLKQFTSKCPWPAALWAKARISIGGQAFEEGDRFVFSAGGGDEPFRCAFVRLSARQPPGSKRRTQREPPRRARVRRGSEISSGARSGPLPSALMDTAIDAAETFELLDWKRRIFGLYAEVRTPPTPWLRG